MATLVILPMEDIVPHASVMVRQTAVTTSRGRVSVGPEGWWGTTVTDVMNHTNTLGILKLEHVIITW